MRAFVSTLIFCVFAAIFAGPAQAHVRHPGNPMVQGIGHGLIHMLRSVRRNEQPVHERHYVAHRRSGHRYAAYRLRKFAQPRIALDAAFTPFEPGPFSMAFGAAQGAIDTAENVAVGMTSHVVEGVSRVIGYRPSDCRGIPWCGCYMRHLLGVSDRSYNLARNWAHYGRPTSPHVGALVVWPHHVGRIVGQDRGRWIVLSGNDGHAVRERPRSLAGAIAFREP
jgi:hypothetical protein